MTSQQQHEFIEKYKRDLRSARESGNLVPTNGVYRMVWERNRFVYPIGVHKDFEELFAGKFDKFTGVKDTMGNKIYTGDYLRLIHPCLTSTHICLVRGMNQSIHRIGGEVIVIGNRHTHKYRRSKGKEWLELRNNI